MLRSAEASLALLAPLAQGVPYPPPESGAVQEVEVLAGRTETVTLRNMGPGDQARWCALRRARCISPCIARVLGIAVD